MKNLLFLALVAAALRLGATPVDSLEARVIAQQYFKYLHPEKSSAAIRKTVAAQYRGVVTRYTFVFENNDFIVVAGDNASVPVLAYSRQQSYVTEDLPPDLSWWMETEYDQWIYSLRIQQVSNSAAMAEWSRIREGPEPDKAGEGVSPLVSSRWGQSRTNDYQCPGYNDKVPDPGFSCSCSKCTAGCVSVAMAQVMNYWRFPESNNGRTFDWCHMPDVLIKMDGAVERPEFSAECNAIAGLLVNCGASANLNYCASGCATSSTIMQAGSAIQGPYGYSSEMQHRYRTLTTGWKNKLKESLDKAMPVLYGGQSGTGGHAFVCDGYESNDYFHFNWGWTGAYDGWFYITAHDGSPEIDYDGLQEALFFIQPGGETMPDCDICYDSLLVSNTLSQTSCNVQFPNLIWSGLPPFYNYFAAINPFIPANSTIVNGNGVLRLQYDDIRSGTIIADQVIIPDRINVNCKAFQEIELSNFETAWGAEFSAEIVECDEGSKSLPTTGMQNGLSFEKSESEEPDSNEGFRIWPNPARGSFMVEYLAEAHETNLFIMRDLRGGELLRISNASNKKGLYQSEIQTALLSSGLYIVELRNNRGVWVEKVRVE